MTHELIDRDPLLAEVIDYWHKQVDNDSIYQYGAIEAKYMIELAPTAQSGWISVKDRLPEHSSTFVLALTAPGTLSVGRNCIVADYIHPRNEPTGVFIPAYGYTDDLLTVTHWMPLPEPPKEDNL